MRILPTVFFALSSLLGGHCLAAETTFVTFPDADAGPTKAWLVAQRDNPQWKWHYDLAYGKRPREELFDLKKDPHQMRNVAVDPAYAQVLDGLEKRLLTELRRTADPRMVDNPQSTLSPLPSLLFPASPIPAGQKRQ